MIEIKFHSAVRNTEKEYNKKKIKILCVSGCCA